MCLLYQIQNLLQAFSSYFLKDLAIFPVFCRPEPKGDRLMRYFLTLPLILGGRVGKSPVPLEDLSADYSLEQTKKQRCGP